ncbi:hypothetical protein M595_2435 [Lyngbya aestuarii BL J]|uniref:Histidine kinase-, DNA gyrase B-, and HSP90-like ATPase family protein n=1 Tax=Lyngbya aestuarii BL J TaxID=1348334 RepID=U7QI96_9CYAN|nr:hypothetical protein M595_2435 [Lyngbya aestuarii BL J]
MLQYEGLIFFDDGTGMSEIKEFNEISPYKAFFSIGRTTKTRGKSIGYKCQGSKLCFASSKITLITRCSDEKNWRSISIDNPKTNLNIDYDISSKSDDTPWLTLEKLFNIPDNRTSPILQYLNQSWFNKKFVNGTMIILQWIEVEDYSSFYDPSPNFDKSYIRNYIRFNTRHGDMRILRPRTTGFPSSKAELFKHTPGYNDSCQLSIWTKDKLTKISSGYPYLEQPNNLEHLTIKKPKEVSRLSDGRFHDTNATTFEFQERTYCITLAIDGHRRALELYKELDRQGRQGRRSGIRLTDQRGTFICSEGVKICQYNELFDHSDLADYTILSSSKAQSHYILMINGSFQVVTDRNSLSEGGLKLMKNDNFIKKIKSFLDQFQRESEVFQQLITRLKQENQSFKIDQYISQINSLKENIIYRPRFQVRDIDHLQGRWLIEPSIGEEHWVGALYTMFSHLVPVDSQYAHFWLRPLTFSGTGIDSMAVEIQEKSLGQNVQKGLEYKYTFDERDEFNHPLIVTDQIVCWDMKIPKDGEQIKDSYDYFGSVALSEELDGIGYEITNIQSYTGEVSNGKIKVISLKKLLDKSFNCEWVTPPDKNSKRKKGKR